MTKERIILGIDPGTIVMGYGLLMVQGNKPKLETMGVLQLNKYENHYLRLRKIFERVLGLIDQYGNASKEQVAGMLQRLFHIPQEAMLPQLDATDGLAAAVCHYFQTNSPVVEKKYNSWKDFIAKNPEKIRR